MHAGRLVRPCEGGTVAAAVIVDGADVRIGGRALSDSLGPPLFIEVLDLGLPRFVDTAILVGAILLGGDVAVPIVGT